MSLSYSLEFYVLILIGHLMESIPRVSEWKLSKTGYLLVSSGKYAAEL